MGRLGTRGARDFREVSPVNSPSKSGPGGLALTRIILWSVVFLAIGIFAFVMIDRRGGDQDSADVAGTGATIGGPFTMTAGNGKLFTQANLAGRPYAIFFGYTRCPDICPDTLGRMAALREAMGADAARYDMVFVSIDPDHDTPAEVGKYVALFGAPIIGLAGTPQQVATIAKAYHVYYAKAAGAGGAAIMDHSAAVLLIDARGQFVTTIDAAESQDMAIGKLKRMIGKT